MGEYIDSQSGITTFSYTDSDGTQTVTLNYTTVGTETNVLGFTANSDGTFTSDTGKGITIQLTSGALADNKVEANEIKIMTTLSYGMSDTNTSAAGTGDGIVKTAEPYLSVMTYQYSDGTEYAFLVGAYKTAGAAPVAGAISSSDLMSKDEIEEDASKVTAYFIYTPKDGEQITKTIGEGDDAQTVTFTNTQPIAKKVSGVV